MTKPMLTTLPLRLALALCGLAATLSPVSADVGSGDIAAIQNFTERMLETARTGTTNAWQNPDSGAVGRVTILSTNHEPGRPPCRRYEWSIRAAGGDGMLGQGEGCRIGAGEWTLDETQTRRAAARRAATPDPAPEPPREPPAASTRSTPRAAPAPAPADPAPAAAGADPTPDPAEKTAEAPAPKKDPLAGLTFTRPPRGATGAVTDAPDSQP